MSRSRYTLLINSLIDSLIDSLIKKILNSRMEQREKNLKLSSKLSFTETGLVEQRTFDSKNISIKHSLKICF